MEIRKIYYADNRHKYIRMNISLRVTVPFETIAIILNLENSPKVMHVCSKF